MGKPAARVGDSTAHGGVISGPGCPTVLIGEAGSGGGSVSAASAAVVSAQITGQQPEEEIAAHILDVTFVDKTGKPVTGFGYKHTSP
jgi:uncharacterized Zn-binding protein involved in type VI secretion